MFFILKFASPAAFPCADSLIPAIPIGLFYFGKSLLIIYQLANKCKLIPLGLLPIFPRTLKAIHMSAFYFFQPNQREKHTVAFYFSKLERLGLAPKLSQI